MTAVVHLQMNYEGYPVSVSSSNKLEYSFISKGPKGEITIVVQFEKINDNSLYNLAFGSRNKDGTINDYIIIDNKDRSRILSTIGVIIYEFTSANPNAFIFFGGTTPSRNRFYRMALGINFLQLKESFRIYGVLQSRNGLIRIPFQKDLNYLGFIVKRKKLNLVHEKSKSQKT